MQCFLKLALFFVIHRVRNLCSSKFVFFQGGLLPVNRCLRWDHYSPKELGQCSHIQIYIYFHSSISGLAQGVWSTVLCDSLIAQIPCPLEHHSLLAEHTQVPLRLLLLVWVLKHNSSKSSFSRIDSLPDGCICRSLPGKGYRDVFTEFSFLNSFLS